MRNRKRKKPQPKIWIQASQLVIGTIGWDKMNDIWDEFRDDCLAKAKWPRLRRDDSSVALVPDTDDPDIFVVEHGPELILGILYTDENGDKVVYFKYAKEDITDSYVAGDGAHKVNIPPT